MCELSWVSQAKHPEIKVGWTGKEPTVRHKLAGYCQAYKAQRRLTYLYYVRGEAQFPERDTGKSTMMQQLMLISHMELSSFLKYHTAKSIWDLKDQKYNLRDFVPH